MSSRDSFPGTMVIGIGKAARQRRRAPESETRGPGPSASTEAPKHQNGDVLVLVDQLARSPRPSSLRG